MSQIDTFFKQYIEAHGFSEPQVYYNLSSCQGDGVSFSGTFLVYDFLDQLELKPQFKFWIKKMQNDGISFMVKISTSGSYCHKNTMNFEFFDYSDDWVSFSFDDDEELKSAFEPTFSQMQDELIDAIKSYAHGICDDLENFGYHYISNHPHYEYPEELRTFKVGCLEIKVQYCDDEYADNDSGDAEYFHQDLMTSFVTNQVNALLVCTASVDGEEIGQFTFGTSFDLDDKASIRFTVREAVSQLIFENKDQIREAIKQCKEDNCEVEQQVEQEEEALCL